MPIDQASIQSVEAVSRLIAGAIGQIQQAAGELMRFNDGVDAGTTPTTELAIGLYTIKEAHGELDEARKLIYHQVERMNKNLLPKRLQNANQDMIRVPSIERSFSIKTSYSASFIDKEAGFAWLRETGNEALIQETVNAGTLASFCRDLILEQGMEPPADIVKVSTYDSMSITKYTPKVGRE